MTPLVPICEALENTQEPTDGLVVGIDLGTTHSLVAYCPSADHAQVIVDPLHGPLLPSAVCYTKQHTHVGAEAIAHAESASPDERLFLSMKRCIGTLNDTQRNDLGMTYHEVQSAERALFQTPQGLKDITHMSSDILKVLKNRAEMHTRQKVIGAVITVPAHFNDTQRQETRLAAHDAHIPVLRLINEPTAAALAYELEKHQEGLFVIYDLGGGTFDLSILHLTDGLFEVVGTDGDAYLGGDNFDFALFEHLCKGHQELAPQDWRSCRLIIRALKEKLSNETTVPYHFVVRQQLIEGYLQRNDFEKITAHWLNKTMQITRRALQKAALTPKDIDAVILVGGATRMPAVSDHLAVLFQKKPLNNIDPDCIVALGAARQAYQITHPKNNPSILLDVTPFSLGIEVMGGLMEVIIPKNTPIPFTQEKIFTTFQDGQTGFVLKVLQGEREKSDDCHTVGLFHLDGLPPRMAGSIRVRIVFQVDVDGILAITAESLDSSHRSRFERRLPRAVNAPEFISRETHISDGQVRQKLEQCVSAQRMIQVVDRFLENTSAAHRSPEVQALIEQRNKLEEYLNKNAPSTIDPHRLTMHINEIDRLATRLTQKKTEL